MNTQTNKFTDLPPMVLSDLLPGDILLSRGCGDLSDLIVKLDGGHYSHAAFFDGENFIQSTMGGVKASEPFLLAEEHQKFMHVYRFHGQDDDTLGSKLLPVFRLIKHAKNLIGTRYAGNDLMLLGAILILKRRLKRKYKMEAGYILKKFGEELSKLLTKKKREKTLTCSALVSDVFWQTSNDRGEPYGLKIRLASIDTDQADMQIENENHEGVELLNEYESLLNEIEYAFEEIQPDVFDQLDQDQSSDKYPITWIAGKDLPSNFITPSNLECSPSLRLVGNYIEKEPKPIKP